MTSVLIAFLLTITLANRLQAMGNFRAWHDDTAILPGFGQIAYSGYPGYPGMQPTQAVFASNGQMPYVIQQAPGHSVLIQPNPGGIPTVTQVPGAVTSV